MKNQAPYAVTIEGKQPRPPRDGMPRDLYDALSAMGGTANGRELALRIGYAISGDVATTLCAMVRKGIIYRIGYDSRAGRGRRPGIYSITKP